MEHVRVWLLTVVLVVAAALGVATNYQMTGATTSPAAGPQLVLMQDTEPTSVDVATTVVDPAGNGQPPVLDQPVPVDPNILMWGTILGVVASLTTSFISRFFPGSHEDAKLKRAVALGVVCLVVAVFDVFVRGVFNTSNYLYSFLTIATTAILFYKGWSASGGLAQRIEGKV